MLQGLSLEVHIPGSIDLGELEKIGAQVVPNPQEGFTAADIVEWAFLQPGAITELHALGVRWSCVTTGAVQQPLALRNSA